MNHLRINYIEYVKTGRNDNKLTTVPYQVSYQHIENYEVILSKYLYACNKVFSLNNLVILQKEAISDLLSTLGAFQRKNQQQKLGICVE